MCGISGFLSLSNSPRKDLDNVFSDINYDMYRRGPDASGFWRSDNYSIGFYHRRLSIIDDNILANQPIVNHELGLVLAFNGEIYNYQELRAQLSSYGYRFSTKSDTEVLLFAFYHWQTQCFDYIRGMYSFVIHNLNSHETYIARDPYGIKPLYYSQHDNSFLFSSQISSLKNSCLSIGGSVSPAGWLSFMLNGSVSEPFTIYNNIYSVPAGSYISIKNGSVSQPVIHSSVADTWLQANSDFPITEGQYVSLIRKHFEDSISHHMIADYPVGLFLSGGIDSSAILSLANLRNQYPISTFTLGFTEFKDTPLDETFLASKVSKIFGSNHTTSWLSNNQLISHASEFHNAIEQPTIDGFNTWLVSNLASSSGFKVVLSGVGADELLGGYSNFWQVPLIYHFINIISGVPCLKSRMRSIAEFLVDYNLLPRKSLSINFRSPSISNIYRFKRSLFSVEELLALFDRDFVYTGVQQLFSNLTNHSNITKASTFASIASLESTLYLKNQLLRDTDWCSMYHSLEVRAPFVDYSLLKSLVDPITSYNKRRLKPSKHALKCLTPTHLPDVMFKKSKTGFNVPLKARLTSIQDFVSSSSFHTSQSLSSPIKQYTYLISSLFL